MSRAAEARDRAAQWIVAREEPGWTTADQSQLDAWLAESDMHRIAFLRLEHSWNEADRLRALQGSPMPTGEAIEAEPPASIYTELDQSRDRRDRAGDHTPRRWLPAAVAASLLAVVGTGWFVFPQMQGSAPAVQVAQYDTPIGGQRKVGLPDGSRIELNTASALRTAVGTVQREVWLDQGEAYFEVAHDKSRPFIVHAGNRQITVLGTKFSVRRDGDKVTVSVLEGRVQVDDIENARAVRSTIITGGDIARSQGPATLVTAKSEDRVESELAWRGGMLSFDQQPLSEVVGEFNRYNKKQMVVTDPAAGSIRIGGMFPASKPEAFVGLLRDAYGLKVEEMPDTIKISN